MARDRGGPKLAFQLLIYPATDCSNETPSQREFQQDGYILSRADMEWFYGHYLSAKDRTNPLACPALAKSLAGLPPAFVLTAAIDPLRDEGEAYGEALRKAGVAVKAKRYDGVCHGFVSMGAMVDAGARAVADWTKSSRCKSSGPNPGRRSQAHDGSRSGPRAARFR
jgi:acetyl esterase